MNQQFDNVQKLGKDNMDVAVKTLGTVSKGAQTFALETADFAKRSFEQSTATFEKLAGAKTFDRAIEIQTDYVKGAFEAFMAQSTKMGELFANVARETLRPYEGMGVRAPQAPTVK